MKTLGPGISRGALQSFLVLTVVVFALSAVNLWWTARETNRVSHQITHSNREWCTTLRLLTSRQIPRPGNPKENQSRATTYRLYADFVQLREEFGCDGAVTGQRVPAIRRTGP